MLAAQQSSLTSLHRDAWVEVDLGALEHNLQVIRTWISPQTALMAVVKSDAYGHGAAGVAPMMAASGAQCFGVASVDEGRQLRAAGIGLPVLILSPCPFWAVSKAIEADLQLTVTAESQVPDIDDAARQLQKPALVHVKVDSGMHRLGVHPSKLSSLLSSIYSRPAIKLAGVFSHLAMADDEAVTKRQNEVFQRAIEQVKATPGFQVHLASGEAARRFAWTHYNMVRVGLYLYGLEPKVISDAVSPALSVRARINHLQQIEEGESAGYNLTWTAQRPSRLASIPIGYADGVDRRLSNRMEGLLMGRRIRQVGLISMDQMLFDITDVPEAQPGDVITLIGSESGPPAAERAKTKSAEDSSLYLATWASMLDTITYELACRLRVRLPRIYTRSKADMGK